MPPNCVAGTPLVPIPYAERDPSHQLTQEIRLTSHDVGGWHWVAGAFYSNLHSVWNEISSNPRSPLSTPQYRTARSSPPGTITGSDRPRCLPTVRTSSPTNGSSPWGRAITTTRATRTSTRGATMARTTRRPPNSKITTAKNSGANPRVNLSYEPGPDLTLYSTVSKGFRPGGANQILPPPNSAALLPAAGPCRSGRIPSGTTRLARRRGSSTAGSPSTATSTTSNGTTSSRCCTLPCGYQFYNNAGNGRSFGPELEINAKLVRRLDRRPQRRLDGREAHATRTRRTPAFWRTSPPSRTV